MPSFKILKESRIDNTFRTQFVRDMFDFQSNKVDHICEGNIKLPKIWNIGVICGRSGTGKSTIAKEVFGITHLPKYSKKSVIDDFDKKHTITHILQTLNIVGFNTPKSWLKPYNVLSTGERMRVDLANALLSKSVPIVFDEFTSVVDRTVAKTASLCVQKAIRKLNKKFIAVTCHRDVLNYLQPDWVFDTDSMCNIHELKKKRCKWMCLDARQHYGESLASIII